MTRAEAIKHDCYACGGEEYAEVAGGNCPVCNGRGWVRERPIRVLPGGRLERIAKALTSTEVTRG